jgi:ABC-2 type transport system permease protein
VSLYRAETRRLTKRRFARWLVIGSLLILVAIAIGIFVTNQKSGPEQIAKAKASAAADLQQSIQQTERDKAACAAAKGTPQADQYPPNCEGFYEPTADDYDYRNYMPSTFDFVENFPIMVTTLAAIFALMAFVIGASFVGAEWSSGGMMNLLLWRPQRLKVLSTKLAALVLNLTVLTVGVLVLWTGFFWLTAKLRGVTAGVTAGAWQSVGLTELRALALVLVAAVLGFGLASLGRHTAVALGAAIGVVIVFQFGLVVVLSLAKVKFAEAYLVPTWVSAWMDKSVKIEDYNACDFSSINGCQPPVLELTWPMAGGVLALVLVLVVGAAMWTMRSRDVA